MQVFPPRRPLEADFIHSLISPPESADVPSPSNLCDHEGPDHSSDTCIVPQMQSNAEVSPAPPLAYPNLTGDMPSTPGTSVPIAVPIAAVCLIAVSCMVFALYAFRRPCQGKRKPDGHRARVASAICRNTDDPKEEGPIPLRNHVPHSAMNPDFEYVLPRHLALLPSSLSWTGGVPNTRMHASMMNHPRSESATSSAVVRSNKSGSGAVASCTSAGIDVVSANIPENSVPQGSHSAPIRRRQHPAPRRTPTTSVLGSPVANAMRIRTESGSTVVLPPYSVGSVTTTHAMHSENSSVNTCHHAGSCSGSGTSPLMLPANDADCMHQRNKFWSTRSGADYTNMRAGKTTGSLSAVCTADGGASSVFRQVSVGPSARHTDRMHVHHALHGPEEPVSAQDSLTLPRPPMNEENNEVQCSDDELSMGNSDPRTITRRQRGKYDASKLRRLHRQLDRFSADDLFLGRFVMLGRDKRRTGGVALMPSMRRSNCNLKYFL